MCNTKIDLLHFIAIAVCAQYYAEKLRVYTPKSILEISPDPKSVCLLYLYRVQ
jgi:hypothetical protein